MGKTHKALFDVAQEYCSLIESARPDDDGWLEDLARLLPRLHALVAALEPVPDGRDSDAESDLDSRFELFSQLHETLGERDGYWLEFDSPRANIPVTGSLADDLTDIYYDLKSGLVRQQRIGDSWATLRDWQSGYSLHWGQHLIDAERHLYTLTARNLLA